MTAVVLGFALAIVGCTAVDSHGEFVPAAPYAQFLSFAKPEKTPPGYRSSARSAIIRDIAYAVRAARSA